MLVSPGQGKGDRISLAEARRRLADAGISKSEPTLQKLIEDPQSPLAGWKELIKENKRWFVWANSVPDAAAALHVQRGAASTLPSNAAPPQTAGYTLDQVAQLVGDLSSRLARLETAITAGSGPLLGTGAGDIEARRSAALEVALRQVISAARQFETAVAAKDASTARLRTSLVAAEEVLASNR